MNRVVKILMQRDGMTKEEAVELIQETKEEMNEAIEAGEYGWAEEVFEGNLGLEPDYIIDIM